jgi:hypothetical protein
MHQTPSCFDDWELTSTTQGPSDRRKCERSASLRFRVGYVRHACATA